MNYTAYPRLWFGFHLIGRRGFVYVTLRLWRWRLHFTRGSSATLIEGGKADAV